MTCNSSASAVLHKSEVIKFGSLTKSVFSDGKQLPIILNAYYADNVVIILEADSANSARNSSHSSDFTLIKLNGTTVSRCDDELFISVRLCNEEQFVALVKIDGDLSALSLILIFREEGLFDNTVTGHHCEVFIIGKLVYCDDSGHLLFLFKLEEVDYVRSLCGS